MSGAVVPGQCLCGAFRFTVSGPLETVRLCHCDFCRRGNGSAFSANCRVPSERFSVVRDEGTLRHFESSPGASRYFCGTCGSPVFARVDNDPNHIRIRLGALDRDTAAEIVAHVWVGSKARWDLISDDLPQFDERASFSLKMSDLITVINTSGQKPTGSSPFEG